MKRLLHLFSYRGFTVVELIIVVFLIGVLVSIATFYSSSADDQIATFRTQGKIIEALYNARSLASGVYGNSTTSETVPCGYGISFNSSTSLTLFQYNPPTSVTNDCSVSDIENDLKNPDNASVIPMQTVSLDAGRIQTNVSMIFFLPPDPQACASDTSGNFYCGGSNEGQWFDVDPSIKVMGRKQNQATALCVSVNRFGQINKPEQCD